MTPAKLDLTIRKNRDYVKVFEFDDGRDISTYDISASIREKHTSTSAKIVDFTVAILSTSSFSLALTEVENDILKSFGYYDILITITDDSQSYVYGKVSFVDTVTEVV